MTPTAFATALAAVSGLPASFGTLDDATLVSTARAAGLLQQRSNAVFAAVAAEVARRSAPSLGSAGLAQSTGHRTPQELLRVTTGTTAREAFTAVRVGLLPTTHPWVPVMANPAAADSLATGLGLPTASVTAAQLAEAAAALAAEGLDADRLLRRAREIRDELDEAGVTDREASRRAERSLKFSRRPNGMAHLSWMMDPETAAIAGELFDRVTSPRRGGPRFVSSPDSDRILDDPRTTDQLASDVFLELVVQGAAADSSQLLGTGAPQLRVLVNAHALESRSGHGFIEGQADPVSIETVERIACTGTVTEVVFATGQPLDVGREQRLYTARQRIALAVRDGGCRWPGCERPPSWTEAHHVRHWQRDHGGTDVADGILLCRHHHLLSHNNHWEIQREGSAYWLVPPPSIDPLQGRIAMPTHSRVMRELAG